MDFEALLPGAEDVSAPSWARNDWPLAPGDDLTRALDAADMMLPAKVAGKAAAVAAAAGASPDAIARAAQDSISALMLIRTYRVRGHLAADLDPLGIIERGNHEQLMAQNGHYAHLFLLQAQGYR